jgi:hypothetical protein
MGVAQMSDRPCTQVLARVASGRVPRSFCSARNLIGSRTPETYSSAALAAAGPADSASWDRFTPALTAYFMYQGLVQVRSIGALGVPWTGCATLLLALAPHLNVALQELDCCPASLALCFAPSPCTTATADITATAALPLPQVGQARYQKARHYTRMAMGKVRPRSVVSAWATTVRSHAAFDGATPGAAGARSLLLESFIPSQSQPPPCLEPTRRRPRWTWRTPRR